MNYNFCIHINKATRVDIYLSALFGELSRSYIQKLIDTGCVRVNGETVKKNLKLQPRDAITIQEIITSYEILAENIPLDIIFEDENLCIINKQAGINVHPTPGIEGKSGTLVNALLYHCKEKLPVISGEQRPGIVHRLDKDTSGALITVKNDMMMHYISDIIKNRDIKKYYIAIVAGVLTQTDFTITSDIGRDPYNKIRMTIQNPLNPKHAITHGKVIGYVDEEYSIIKIDLETGRTHQIRVHLASIGYPILGDSVYGNPKVNKRIATKHQIHRQALHAYRLDFELYSKAVSFIAPLKHDMQSMIGELDLENI
ncbi:RluA family pseudouridine synthase [Candidatus Gracilibacteria bacterium]|nr:RluA family pseudouridine synthase [Candidatus Gracilibacteria bacterium]